MKINGKEEIIEVDVISFLQIVFQFFIHTIQALNLRMEQKIETLSGFKMQIENVRATP